MSSTSMSLKARINNYSKEHSIAAQVVLQNYMFERFLERLSNSEYKDKFVIKGGMLIATIVGLDIRSTIDMDTTLRNLPFTEDQIEQTIKSICSVALAAAFLTSRIIGYQQTNLHHPAIIDKAL